MKLLIDGFDWKHTQTSYTMRELWHGMMPDLKKERILGYKFIVGHEIVVRRQV